AALARGPAPRMHPRGRQAGGERGGGEHLPSPRRIAPIGAVTALAGSQNPLKSVKHRLWLYTRPPFTLYGGGTMGDYAKDVLVETQWVEDHLGDDSIRIVEVDENPALYAEAHIPGAIGFDWKNDLQHQVK